jgi:phage gp29-like protein
MATNAISRFTRGLKGIFGKPAAGLDTDPQFFSKMHALPNPDPILRAMGMADTVYASIMADAHVTGEIRSIRGEMLGMDYRIGTWAEDDPRAMAARDLCERWMQACAPSDTADWLEVMWQMMSAVLVGRTAHELIWGMWEGFTVPVQVLDRPGRRFQFNADAQLLLLTRQQPLGAVVEEPYQFIISRNMPSIQNPYGTALLSACFWPWTFKTGGWRYFVKYCERHGLPWPVGRYGMGATDEDQKALAEAMEAMIDSGYAVVPEGSGIELIVPTGGGSTLPQESLINLANREMSKALTGQAMVAELTNVGSRAASETALSRQSSINDADRGIAASSFSRIFRFITDFNFGPDVPSPELEFFKQTAAGKDRAETYQIAANAGARPSRKAMLDELSIPQAADDADALLPVRPAAPAANFAASGKAAVIQRDPWLTALAANAQSEDERIDAASRAADALIEKNVLQPIANMMAQYEKDGKTLAEFNAALGDLLVGMDDTERRDMAFKAMTWQYAQGYVDAEAEHDD